jgi:hypothetical protein
VVDLDAAALVGLLADSHRRRVVAAVELGARRVDEIIAATSLASNQVTRALGKLVDSALIVDSVEGFVVAADVFQLAARAANMRPPSQEFADSPDDSRKVLRSFIVDGRLQSIPVAPAKRMVVLDWLAQEFEPGVKYSEQMVNLIIGQRHPDTAALRRYLVDSELLDRADGQYWRAGGTVEG